MKTPAFQFYPGDYLASQRVQMMTLEEEGAYIRLLCYCWQHGSIPSDPEKVARLIGKGGSTTLATTVLTMFQPGVDHGTMTHERLEAEKDKQAAWREKSAAGGRKSAEKRKGGSTTVPRVVEKCYQPNGNTSSSSSSSSSFSLEPESISAQSSSTPSPHPKPGKPVGGVDEKFEEFWRLVPVKIGKGAARKAWKKAVKVATPDEIIAGIPKFRRYEATRASQPDYRPLHPSTWLNGERWQDEGVSTGTPPPAPKLVEPVPPTPGDFEEWFLANVMNATRFTPEQIAEKWGEQYFRDTYQKTKRPA